jgi:fimbrial isopeptide formation D2 family protein
MGVQNIYDDNPANTYDFDFEINSEYAAYYAETPTNFNDLSIAFGSGVQTLYFPITVTQVYNDVEVSITALSVPRPGFSYTHKIIYKNKGHNPTSGTITYTKSNANIAITSTLPIATTTTSNGFTYDYSNLLPGETKSIFVNMLVATIPTVNLGDVVTNTASITSDVSDVNTTNNTFSNTQIVVGSYDPNDKNEARGPNVEIGQFTQADYLFYTIRFQNSGTASAETVRIEDTLESEFDFASIRMISASHDYTMQRINNNVVWTFNNINLPSENQDEPGSQGYVTFKIKLNPGFAVGDVIENTAEIYFDFNPAIITNTFQTTFVPNLSTSTFDGSNLVIYPNPAREMVQVSMTNSTETLSKIVIYDMIGKMIKTISGNNVPQVSIPVNDLATGVYLMEITTETNLKQVKKLLIK